MKIKGLQFNTKTRKVKEVFEEISDKEYQRKLEEAKKVEKEMKMREMIERKKQEILERLAKQELIKKGKLPKDSDNKIA